LKSDIKSLSPTDLEAYFASIGERPFRAEQVFRWLHDCATAFSEMTNLSEALRQRLSDEFYISAPEMLQKQASKIDGTVKYLWRFDDGNSIESVLMEYEHGLTVCISTQVGCRMGCAFCASTIGGLERNLAASEMLDQILFSQRDAGKRISNVVLMGIGEPLDNFENVMKFLELATHPLGLNIGTRHISLSTCGIVEKIDKMAELDIKSTLAVSLHAPDDETRSRLMPINSSGGVAELFSACERYFAATGRRVTYEYAMIGGVNDYSWQAELLADRLAHSGSHLNLILLNEVPERGFAPCGKASFDAFTRVLKDRGVNYTLRRRLGGDIDAACGQLRQRKGMA